MSRDSSTVSTAQSGQGRSRLVVGLGVLTLVVSVFVLDLDRYLELDYLRARQGVLLAWVDANPVQAAAAFFATYAVAAALAIPGAALLTLVGGALFGLAAGTVLSSFASTLGATLAFLLSRFVFRDALKRRFANQIAVLDRGIHRDGPYYLFTLRLLPVLPFFIVNLAMGLTALRASTFWWVSQLGTFPGTIILANAGTHLARVQSVAEAFTPGVIISFCLLGAFPFIARKGLELLRRPTR